MHSGWGTGEQSHAFKVCLRGSYSPRSNPSSFDSKDQIPAALRMPLEVDCGFISKFSSLLRNLQRWCLSTFNPLFPIKCISYTSLEDTIVGQHLPKCVSTALMLLDAKTRSVNKRACVKISLRDAGVKQSSSSVFTARFLRAFKMPM